MSKENTSAGRTAPEDPGSTLFRTGTGVLRVLIADDDPTSCHILEAVLRKWGYKPVVARDGLEAWNVFKSDYPPHLAILDWMMPGMDGLEICRKVRSLTNLSPPYLILLTALGDKEDIVTGLDAGANDYLTKPFDPNELRARVRVGERVLELQHSLAARVLELQDTLDHVKTLQGLLPICMHCHKIRNDADAWQALEEYIVEHSGAQLSHGLCPECRAKYYPPLSTSREKQKVESGK
jgi:sigma-B regulation protein RsbU (phosphoserine phosphatase)